MRKTIIALFALSLFGWSSAGAGWDKDVKGEINRKKYDDQPTMNFLIIRRTRRL